MQHPILKLTALAGVVGIGFLVVYQAQKGMSHPASQVDTQQAFADLGAPADDPGDAPPPQKDVEAGDAPKDGATAKTGEPFPFGNEPAVTPSSGSGISFLEQKEPKGPAPDAPKAGYAHDHDRADPHSKIATTSNDADASKSFDPFATDSKSKAKTAELPEAADGKSAVKDSNAAKDAEKGMQQVGFDPPPAGAPPTLADAKEPAPAPPGIASTASSPSGGPQLFAPNPEPSAPGEGEHGKPDAFPFDAKNVPRPISEKDSASTADPHSNDKPDAGPFAPTKDTLNDPVADHAAKDSKEHDPIGDAPAPKDNPFATTGDKPKAVETTAGDSIPVDLGAKGQKEKTDTASGLGRPSPSLDVPDPTLSNPFGSADKSDQKDSKKDATEPAPSEPAKIDGDTAPARPAHDEQPAAKDLNERPKSNEQIAIPQRHEAPEEAPAAKEPETSEPPLIHGDGGSTNGLPTITPRFPKHGGEATKPAPKATHEPEPAPVARPVDALNGDGTIREDAPQGPQQPRLKLEKSAPANAITGQPMVYEIFVENVGNSPAHKVVVQDRIPRGSKLSGTIPRAELINRQLTWKLGTLDPGEKQKISVRVVPTDPGTLGSVATVSFEAQVAARTVITAPKVSVDAIGPQRAKIGEPVTFHFKVTNEGSGTAQKVVLRNILPSGLNHAAGKELEYDVGTLAPGAARDIELTLTAAEAGDMVNRTVVTTADGFSAEAKSKLHVEELGLLINREGPSRRVVGRVAAFVNTVTNRSSQPMYGIQVVETIPEGMEFVEASDGGRCDATQRKVLWQIDKLNPGEDRKVQVKLMPREAGDAASSVTAIDRNGNKVETKSLTAVTGFAAVTLEMPAVPGPVEVGETVTLRIEAGNKGSSAATNVRLNVNVSDEMELVSIKGATAHEQKGNAMRFAPIPTLGERTPAVFEVVLKARRSGDARVAVQIEADQLSKPIHREEAILILPSGQ